MVPTAHRLLGAGEMAPAERRFYEHKQWLPAPTQKLGAAADSCSPLTPTEELQDQWDSSGKNKVWSNWEKQPVLTSVSFPRGTRRLASPHKPRNFLPSKEELTNCPPERYFCQNGKPFNIQQYPLLRPGVQRGIIYTVGLGQISLSFEKKIIKKQTQQC